MEGSPAELPSNVVVAHLVKREATDASLVCQAIPLMAQLYQLPVLGLYFYLHGLVLSCLVLQAHDQGLHLSDGKLLVATGHFIVGTLLLEAGDLFLSLVKFDLKTVL